MGDWSEAFDPAKMRKAFERMAKTALVTGDKDLWRAALNVSVLSDDDDLRRLWRWLK